MASEDDIKRELKNIELKKQAANLADRANKSMKGLAETVDGLRDIEKEILDLEQEIEYWRSQNTEEAEKIVAELENERDLMKNKSKEIKKQLSLTKALANSTLSYLKGQQFFLMDILNMYNEMDRVIRQTSASMGLSTVQMSFFRTTVADAASDVSLLGISATDLANAQASFAEETGRAVLLSKQALVEFSRIGKETGIGLENVSQLAGQMEAFGMGSTQSAEIMRDIQDTTQKMGINTGKVIKKFQQNLGLLNKLAFKDGVKGLAKMAAHSEKFKLSMEAVAGVSEQVFRPEGAIEAAANLQVLGGSLAQLGDPFQLMYQARHAPEELAKSLSSAAAQSAVFNKETGEFELNALELDRMREAAQALGIPMEELVTTAKQTAKMNMLEGMLGGVGEEDRELLASMAEMDEKGAYITISGEKKYLDNMKSGQAELFAEQLRQNKMQAEQAQTSLDLLSNIKNTILTSFLPLFQALDKNLRPIIEDTILPFITETLVPFIKGTFIPTMKMLINTLGPKGIIAVALGMMASKWIMRGIWLAQGFKIGIGKFRPFGGLRDRIKKWRGGGATSGGQSGVTKSATPKGNQAGQVGKVGKGLDPSKMIKGAAAILIMSAALFVFAKALQEFEKLENGWETLAIAAVSLVTLSGALFLVGKIMSKATGDILMGSIAIVALGVALIPFAYAMSLIKDVGVGTMLGAALALGAFALAAALMGPALVPILLGSVAIIALSGALMVFGLAMQVVAPGMEMFINSMSQLPAIIPSILMMGPALLGLSLGIFALGASLLFLGAAYLMGGFLGLLALGETAQELQTAFQGIDSDGIDKAITSINNVDMEKVNALKELSAMMSFWGMFGGSNIKIEFGEIAVGGTIDIEGEGGGKKSTDWVNDPIFKRNLKSMIMEQIEADKKGNR